MRRLGKDGMDVEYDTTVQGNQPGESSHVDSTREEDIQTEAPLDEEAKEYPTGLKFWLITLTLIAVLVLGGLDTNIVATAVPRYVQESQCPVRYTHGKLIVLHFVV